MRLGDVVDDRYRLQEGPVLGGRAEVWLAHDTELGQSVALKRARVEDPSPGAFARLRAEARALARFRDHPHVVTLYDAVRVGEGPSAECWLVMEYAPGGSLVGQPRMTPAQAARVGAQIAGALAALHAAGIVHCDVKPGNIVLSGNGTAKLTDLDAAHRVGGAETLTPGQGVSYTPDYAAPELVRGSPLPASDVFSLAATLYELVVGEPPRDIDDGGDDEGDSRVRELRLRRGAVRLDGELGPLRDPLTRMLQPHPRDRPDVREVHRVLERVAGNQDRSVPGRLLAVARDRPWTATGTAAAVLALAVVPFTPLLDDGDGPHRPGRAAPVSPSASAGAAAPGAWPFGGDPREADPCALLRPTDLGRFGATELDRDYGNFDRCDVLVSHGGNRVDVKVLFESRPAPESASTRTTGKVTVVEEPAESDACDRTLLPRGARTFGVNISATLTDGDEEPLCAMADAVLTHAVDVLNDGPVPRRSPRLPSSSLIHEDACTLVDGDALSVVPGVNADAPDVGFGNWDCGWYSTTSDIDASLRFDRGQPLAAIDGRRTRLGGHDAAVERDGDGEGSCVVRSAHRTYTDQDGRRAIEMLYVVVDGPQPTDRLCSMATALAASAGTALPQP